MAEVPEWLTKELEGLRQLRDEARLQLHLARADAREVFDGVERQWQHLEGKLDVLRRETRGDLAEIGDAARLLAEQIRDGYRHLKTLL
jgi:hypothetical protein